MEQPPLDSEVVDCILAIVSHVIHASHDTLHHVMSLWDFLLLIHPAANTFVRHSATDFYFRLSNSEYRRPTNCI